MRCWQSTRSNPMAKNKPDDRALVSALPADAVLQVKQWIVEGQQAADISAAAYKQFPKIRTDLLLGAALDELRTEATDIDTAAARGFLLSAYREIYRRTLDIGDFGNALSALRAFERQIKTGPD